jgi:outer membrane protein
MQFIINRILSILHWSILLLNLSLSFYSQPDTILEDYISIGVNNNLALQQKELDLEKSLHALHEASGLFYPSITLESQYFLANGGRSIDLPVGDMLNPVYSSLNQILQNMGQTVEFPLIENQKIEFLPNDYHDTRIRVIMPLINTEIFYNRKIQKELISTAEASINVYKRELIKEIKVAYMRYLQAIQVEEAYKSALELVNEGIRVNKKLIENEMAGIEKLYRIEAEKNKVIVELTKAETNKTTAAAYFNFLLNQPLNNKVHIDSVLMVSTTFSESVQKPGEVYREEIEQLNSAVTSSTYYYKMKKSWMIPTLTNITDLGYQGYKYKFNQEQQYVLNTINLSWPIFNGFQHRSMVSQARIEKEKIQNQLTQVEQQIELQCRIAAANLETSVKSEEANVSSLTSSMEYYKIISKQYALGKRSLLDLLDAQNQLTNARISHAVAHYETLIQMAEVERAYASFDFTTIK